MIKFCVNLKVYQLHAESANFSLADVKEHTSW